MGRTLLLSLLLACTPAVHAQVVVLTHPESGAFVVVSNTPDPKAQAMKQAYKKQLGNGWTTMLASIAPGYGSMFCFRPKGGQVNFFLVEGKDSGTDAITEARAQANAAARGTGATTYICGQWNNRNLHPLDSYPDLPSKKPRSGGDATVTGVRG